MRKVIYFITITIMIMFFSGCELEGETHVVTFDSVDGSEVKTIEVEDGQIPDIPLISREGYTLEGWYTSVNEGITLDERWSFISDTVSNDITLYANWVINEYNLKIVDYDGTEIINESVEYGADLENFLLILEMPTRKGHTFAGWDSDLPETMPSDDVNLRAVYSVNEYTISFVDYNGVILQTSEFSYDESLSTLTFPEDPVREGYTFDGWSSDYDLTSIISSSMPDYDILIVAEYSNVVTIEELVTNPDMYIGHEVTVTGTITRKVGRHGYIQSGEYGIYVYTGFEYTTKFQVGNTVTLHDVVPTYYPDEDTGMLQLSGFRARNLETLSSANDIAPNLITISELTDNMIGSLVEIHNLTIIEVFPGMDGEFTVHTEDEYGNMIILRKDSSSSEDILITDYIVGKVLNIVGPVHVINSEKVIMITTNDDITFID